MFTRASVGARGALLRSGLWLGLIAALAVPFVASIAESKITLRPQSPTDVFYFHGKYARQPFDPSSRLGVQVWNCANGAMPAFIADRQPLIVCGYDAATGYDMADLVYEVELPAGACVDHGWSCYYRDPSAARDGGIRSLRVEYARRGGNNRVWLESFGDLSGAHQANMLIAITIDGIPRATLQDTFIPLPNGGWFSPY